MKLLEAALKAHDYHLAAHCILLGILDTLDQDPNLQVLIKQARQGKDGAADRAAAELAKLGLARSR